MRLRFALKSSSEFCGPLKPCRLHSCAIPFLRNSAKASRTSSLILAALPSLIAFSSSLFNSGFILKRNITDLISYTNLYVATIDKYYICVATMPDKRQRELKDKLDKCYKIVQQSRTGISAQNVAKKFQPLIHRATAHRLLNTLDLMEKVYSDHGLWRVKSPIKDLPPFFLDSFWEELFEIRKEIHRPSAGSAKAFLELRSLVMMLPKNLKEKLIPDFESVKWNDDYSIMRLDEKPRSLRECELESIRVATELVDRVSTVLHEELKNKEETERKAELE